MSVPAVKMVGSQHKSSGFPRCVRAPMLSSPAISQSPATRM
ncbi:hypothetical protein NSERUTF1_5589 [Nocardia seriolae]|nr:hypothetical protein NSERUTF1_5589 [Nocardia seriolae]